mmetsp:Transcript_90629/g.233955  ORF Transcript_90629/g.233955 Transcript_90629/m.233955 type:complete len:270 (+) Transcript_90629:1-810(+)
MADRQAQRSGRALLLLVAAIAALGLALPRVSPRGGQTCFLGGPRASLAGRDLEHRQRLARTWRRTAASEAEANPVSRRDMAWLASVAAAAPLPVQAGLNDNIDADSFLTESDAPGDVQINDEQKLLKPSVRSYLQTVAAKVESATGLRVFLLAPPQGFDELKRTRYLRAIKQSIGADGSIVLTADASFPKVLDISVGFKASKAFPDLFPESYVEDALKTFGGQDAEGAALAAYENIAACLLLAKDGKTSTCTQVLPSSEVRKVLPAPKL